MLLKSYLIYGCMVLGTFTGLAAMNVKMPRAAPSSGGYGSGPHYGYPMGGWGFGK